MSSAARRFSRFLPAIVLVVTACAPAAPPPAAPTAAPQPAAAAAQRQPQAGGAIVAALRADPFQLDPIKDLGSDGNDVMLTSQAVESLIDVGHDGQPTPSLAEAMPDVSADGLTYTFKLRKGVKFH